MAGRIREADIHTVRSNTNLVDLVGSYVNLKRTGTSWKGLCPFHDEKTPSFTVSPDRGWWCFGCGVGGDAIGFLMQMDHLSFPEAVERLAEEQGFTLTYEDVAAESAAAPTGPTRSKLVAVNAAAASFYQALLTGQDALPGRQFLAGRGFDRHAAEQFGIGFAPDSWDATVEHLRGHGFTDEEIVAAGLASLSKNGRPVDRFRGRLVWPIQDLSGDIVGFGARRLLDTDDGPKYLNTPETSIFKKSRLLYGLHAARKSITGSGTVVVVEGYTDVMACHLAGVSTAVATCGTAFGEDHTRLIRRLLGDGTSMSGEVVFTFDGDAAGQKAAVRAFQFDGQFQAATYVAIEPRGMDPCELRQDGGDEAVRNLVAARVPLAEFVIKATLARHDTSTPEGQAVALRDAAPVLARIPDPVLRMTYVRKLSGWLGLLHDRPVETAVQQAVRDTISKTSGTPSTPNSNGTGEATAAGQAHQPGNEATSHPDRPDPSDPTLLVQRDLLTLILQQPSRAATAFRELNPAQFTHPAYSTLWERLRPLLPDHREPGPLLDALSSAPEVFDLARELSLSQPKLVEGKDEPGTVIDKHTWWTVLGWCDRENATLTEQIARAETDSDKLNVWIQQQEQEQALQQQQTRARAALAALTY